MIKLRTKKKNQFNFIFHWNQWFYIIIAVCDGVAFLLRFSSSFSFSLSYLIETNKSYSSSVFSCVSWEPKENETKKLTKY